MNLSHTLPGQQALALRFGQIGLAGAPLVATTKVAEDRGSANPGIAPIPRLLVLIELLPMGCGGAGARVVRV